PTHRTGNSVHRRTTAAKNTVAQPHQRLAFLNSCKKAAGDRQRLFDYTVPMRKFAAMMAILSGLGFGLPAAYGTWYYARYGFAWHFMGFPTHETGRFFEQFGLFTSWPLIAGFV